MSKGQEYEPASHDEPVRMNRREAQRMVVRLGVTMTSDSNFYVGFAGNMSEGGLFVATHELLPIGSKVDFEFSLPNEKRPIKVAGEVRWHCVVNDLANDVLPGFGAEFIDLQPRDRALLESFLETREPLFHPE